MDIKKLQRAQLHQKFAAFKGAENAMPPSVGWIKTVRVSLGMTLQQLANRLSVTKQNVSVLESSEAEGSITLKRLREVANGLDMNLVYGFVPKDGSIDQLIDRKAKALATQIVSRTSATMRLEDQENHPERIERAIQERTERIKQELPKSLWD
jgi:predicted DNA-binding mobile mystery protein A